MTDDPVALLREAADNLRNLAEFDLHDGDADRPLPGYMTACGIADTLSGAVLAEVVRLRAQVEAVRALRDRSIRRWRERGCGGAAILTVEDLERALGGSDE